MIDVRTWIEVRKRALYANADNFLSLIPSHTLLMAVVKSNAYGHGLSLIAELMHNYPAFTKNGWFGVDSIVEALRLRKDGVTSPLLVLGFTLPSRIAEADAHDIALSISSFDALHALTTARSRPSFHLKIDTGMHRQGFLLDEMTHVIRELKKKKLKPAGIFTHFASAKDAAYPGYTVLQMREFYAAMKHISEAGFGDMIRHAAASGGTLLFPDTHLDMVRIGMGLYGYWPSPEAELQNRLPSGFTLKPVLTWKTVISEIKEIPKGSYVGYDLTCRVTKKSRIAILPIGYWHGYDRGLGNIGEVLVKGRRARVLGRISMDMTTIDLTGIPNVRPGDEVVLLGSQGKDAIWADELAHLIGTSAYELLTRINPLIRRIAI